MGNGIMFCVRNLLRHDCVIILPISMCNFLLMSEFLALCITALFLLFHCILHCFLDRRFSYLVVYIIFAVYRVFQVKEVAGFFMFSSKFLLLIHVFSALVTATLMDLFSSIFSKTSFE